ncbi:hypothetical protein [Pseudonocardia sp. H11422]|uniref:hypothetical protein n=1 Tax=Pseudonocardia sp. H11422 TaxID=2835866 RepID=UPI001BDBBA40|nr:hypothetical protein [Pseudonocardia sp. H11422]
MSRRSWLAAVAMAVGSTWIKELSEPPHDPGAAPGARRAALGLTLGSGLGAGVAGVLAQCGPWPMVLPYLVHAALTLAVLPLLPGRPEARPADGPTGSLRARAAVPVVRHPRFLRVVLPMAPWIFATSGVAYAILPQVVGGQLGRWGLAAAAGSPRAALIAGAPAGGPARRRPLTWSRMGSADEQADIDEGVVRARSAGGAVGRAGGGRGARRARTGPW